RGRVGFLFAVVASLQKLDLHLK
ncbi:rCG22636, partial [Rattus norvegicus]